MFPPEIMLGGLEILIQGSLLVSISSVGNLVIFVDGQCSEKLFAPLRYCL